MDTDSIDYKELLNQRDETPEMEIGWNTNQSINQWILVNRFMNQPTNQPTKHESIERE